MRIITPLMLWLAACAPAGEPLTNDSGGPDDTGTQQADDTGSQADTEDTADTDTTPTLARIEGPWRMPLEALAYHRRQLREVVIVFSNGKNDAKNQFLELLRGLWPDCRARLRTHSEILGDLQDGVDFFDLEAMVEVTEELFHRLQRERHLKASEILIDITGGPKVASAAGAVVALVEWRRFQYVQQTPDGTFSVTTFDPTYETGGPP